MSVTMKDIAELTGVSRVVVSAVLNEAEYCRVSDAKRREIKEVANRLGFQRNFAAMQLRGNATKTLAVFINSVVRAEIIWQLNQLFAPLGYRLYLTPLDDAAPPSELQELVNEYLARGVDGILLLWVSHSLNRRQLEVPVVEGFGPDGNSDVTIDVEAGARLAAAHLLQHGHRQFALVCTNAGHIHNRRKLVGMLQAGIAPEAIRVIDLADCPHPAETLTDAVRRHGISGILTSNDYIAGKLLLLFRENNIAVPQDAAVIGFNGLAFSRFTQPTLTTVLEPAIALTEQAGQLLLRKINKKPLPETPLILQPELVLGESCGCRTEKLEEMDWNSTFVTLEKPADGVAVPRQSTEWQPGKKP